MKKISVGNVCKCSHNKLGVIVKISKSKFKGIGFDGKPWESTSPTFIAKNLEEFCSK